MMMVVHSEQSQRTKQGVKFSYRWKHVHHTFIRGRLFLAPLLAVAESNQCTFRCTKLSIMGNDEAKESSKKKRKRSRKSKSSTVADDEAAVVPPDDNEDIIKSEKDNDKDEDGAHKSTDDTAAISTKEEQNGEGDADDDEDVPKKRKRKRNRKKKNDDTPTADGVSTAATSDDATAAKLSSVEHTVFIEGLPFTSTEEQIRAFFTQHGCNDILQLRLPTWQDSGRLRGFGHVVFASQATRQLALSSKVNGQELGGRYITVKEANAPRAGTTAGAAMGSGQTREQPKGCKTVFIRNLPYEASEDDILDAFRTYGKIVDGGVRVVRNHTTGVSKGFGYVEFKNEEGALAAVQKASKPFGLVVMKRPVFVDYDEGSMKGSFRDKEGKLWNKSGNTNKSGRGNSGRGRGGGRGGRGGYMR